MAGKAGHAPRGACELKYLESVSKLLGIGHAPRGACELKYTGDLPYRYELASHAPRGACELKLLKLFWPTKKEP